MISSLFFLRLAVGIIFLVHGIPKFKMWKMKASPEMPSKMLMIMKALSLAEPAAAVILISGVWAKLAAAVLSLVMIGAIYFKIFVWKKKFSEPGGWELDFLILMANLTIILIK